MIDIGVSILENVSRTYWYNMKTKSTGMAPRFLFYFLKQASNKIEQNEVWQVHSLLDQPDPRLFVIPVNFVSIPF